MPPSRAKTNIFCLCGSEEPSLDKLDHKCNRPIKFFIIPLVALHL